MWVAGMRIFDETLGIEAEQAERLLHRRDLAFVVEEGAAGGVQNGAVVRPGVGHDRVRRRARRKSRSGRRQATQHAPAPHGETHPGVHVPLPVRWAMMIEAVNRLTILHGAARTGRLLECLVREVRDASTASTSRHRAGRQEAGVSALLNWPRLWRIMSM